MFLLDDPVANEIVWRAVRISLDHVGRCVPSEDVLVGSYEETASPARGIAYLLAYVGFHELHDHADYVSWSPELTVLACGLKLTQQVFVDVSLNVGFVGCLNLIDD